MARESFFSGRSFKEAVNQTLSEIREMYLADSFPWVVGYSGGKDSTATLQLVWYALASLTPEERSKPIHVISTDTLVENPIVALWVTKSLEKMSEAAACGDLPLQVNRLTPAVEDSFWVNLVGKGYPAPRPKFRWCTERLKIRPSNQFIRDVVTESGEAILVLGTRKAESSNRHSNMDRYASKSVRDNLSPNGNLPNCWIYTPIAEWTNDDVWMYLMQQGNPWGYNNKDLLTMYQGASSDGECPLVVDTSTPSCGDSRFGCWVCTLVDQDRSMTAMIQNDSEKQWMQPLLDLRNELDYRRFPAEEGDRSLRDFRRLTGKVQVFRDRLIAGPYTKSVRERWLHKILTAQEWVRRHGPDETRDLELITLDELHEIRRIWVVEKHEFEDSLPGIYGETTGMPFPAGPMDDNLPFNKEDLSVLKEVCDNDLEYQLVRELIDIERRYRTKVRRAGLFGELENAIRKGFYKGEEDALVFAINRNKLRHQESSRDHHQEGIPV